MKLISNVIKRSKYTFYPSVKQKTNKQQQQQQTMPENNF